MDWYMVIWAAMAVAPIYAMWALFGDPEKARDRLLTAIFLELSAISGLLWL